MNTIERFSLEIHNKDAIIDRPRQDIVHKNLITNPAGAEKTCVDKHKIELCQKWNIDLRGGSRNILEVCDNYSKVILH